MVYPPSSSSFQAFYDCTYECKYSELKNISSQKTSHKKLPLLRDKILQFIAANDNISAAEFSKKFSYSKKSIDSGNAKKYLRILFSLKLLDRYGSPQKYYYKVSDGGIFNLIANHENLPSDTVKSLLLNHKDHVLFAFFLFPYLKEETLAKLYDSSMISRIFSYLHECCRLVDDMIHVINHTSNQRDGFITDQIFIWENIPGMESDTEGLRTFLQQKFGWNWLRKAEIKKSEDLNSIRISYGSDLILIKVDRTKRKATLSLRGKIEYEFYIRNVLNQLIVEIPIRRLLSHHMLIFLISIQSRIPDFIFSLLSDYGPDHLHPAFELLGKDERFVNALQKAKNQFDKKYKLITRS